MLNPRHRNIARVVFSFLICAAFFGILVKQSSGYRLLGAILSEQIESEGIVTLGPAVLIVCSSFGEARLYKRVFFWLGWVVFAGFAITVSLTAESWITPVSCIPFLVSSTVAVLIRVRERDGT